MDSFLKFLEDNCPGDDAHDGHGDPRPLLERCGMCASLHEAHRKEMNLRNGEWEKLVRAAADQVYALGKQLRGGDEAATGMTLQVLSTEMHRECQVIKGEEPLPHAGERLTEKPFCPGHGVTHQMWECAEKRKDEA